MMMMAVMMVHPRITSSCLHFHAHTFKLAFPLSHNVTASFARPLSVVEDLRHEEAEKDRRDKDDGVNKV